MPTGVVKWFSDQKGYGFIVRDEGGEDVFVHHTGIQGTGRRSLQEGQRVEFEVTQGPKGPQATNVRPGSVEGAGPGPEDPGSFRPPPPAEPPPSGDG